MRATDTGHTDGGDRAAPAADRPQVVLLDGSSSWPRDLLGNKGFGINSMRAEGLPVPPAFCITTETCGRYFADADGCLDGVWTQITDAMKFLERETDRTFGSGPRPLLVSVRSGAALSMPGMMDTVLDLGVTDRLERDLAAQFTTAFAADTRRRFEDMYRRMVLAGRDGTVPLDPYLQLRKAIAAVFDSWNSPRARTYRAHHGLLETGGTAVVVQAMVFGNFETRSGTGVLFSRNPMTGADEPFGEWLRGGQGEDVVSGGSDVEPMSVLADDEPGLHRELIAAAQILERLNADVQDIEYTVENGKLWLLQTRSAKRSAQAAVRFSLQLRREGLIDDLEAARRVSPSQIEMLLSPSLQPEERMSAILLAKGLPASPGAVSGRAYGDVDNAIDAADEGEDVILVRVATSPDDVQGMLAARGVVTDVGGATSHAAVVSREIGRPAIVGCGTGVAASLEGRMITIDGNVGEVREGRLSLSAWSERDSPELAEFADLVRRACTRVGIDPSRNDDDSLVATLTALHSTDDPRKVHDG